MFCSMRLLLIGCTGFIGQELVPQLLRNGHHLTVLSRKSPIQLNQSLSADQLVRLEVNPSELKSWEREELINAVSKADGVINLAGESIAEKRWTENHCQELISSRINATEGLMNCISKLRKPPKVVINASAIGYYGTSREANFTEESASGADFLANLCSKWESAARKKPRSTRLLILRIGIVLGSNGGALGRMLPVFKAGLGGPIGDGYQWMSWIHRTDLCKIIQQGLTNKSWSGVINAVAPNPASMKCFAKTLGKGLGRPSLLPVPGAILKFLLGDGARVVLEGQKVESIYLKQLGYKFKYPELKQAIMQIIKTS